MKYVVTFEDYDCDAISVVVDAPYMEYAIVYAQEKTGYSDSSILSVIRI